MALLWDRIKLTLSTSLGVTQKLALPRAHPWLKTAIPVGTRVYVRVNGNLEVGTVEGTENISTETVCMDKEHTSGNAKQSASSSNSKQLLSYRVSVPGQGIVIADHTRVALMAVIDPADKELVRDYPTLVIAHVEEGNDPSIGQRVVAHKDIPRGTYPLVPFVPLYFHGVRPDGSCWFTGFLASPPDNENGLKSYFVNPFLNVEYSALPLVSNLVCFAAGSLDGFLSSFKSWTGKNLQKLAPLHEKLFIPDCAAVINAPAPTKIIYKIGELLAYNAVEDKFIAHFFVRFQLCIFSI